MVYSLGLPEKRRGDNRATRCGEPRNSSSGSGSRTRLGSRHAKTNQLTRLRRPIALHQLCDGASDVNSNDK
jgi:hypothetical protein